MTLRRALRNRHDSTVIKVELVRALLCGALTVSTSLDGSVGGLVLAGSAYRSLVEKLRKRHPGNVVSQSQIALGSHPEGVGKAPASSVWLRDGAA
jgi:hypothetical protein